MEPISITGGRASALPFRHQRTWIVLRLWELWAHLHLGMFAGRALSPRILIYGQGRSGTTLLEDLL